MRKLLLLVATAAPDASSAAAAGCNLAGNWGGIGYAGSLFQIVQQSGPKFTVFYSQAPQGLPGSVAGSEVEIPGWAGVIGTSPYRDLRTNATAPACTYLNFNESKALWCKFPYCPAPEPPAPPPPAPTVNVPLTLLPQNAGDESPATLDGSPYGLYFKPSQSGKSRKWTISIEGGGKVWAVPKLYRTNILSDPLADRLVLQRGRVPCKEQGRLRHEHCLAAHHALFSRAGRVPFQTVGDGLHER